MSCVHTLGFHVMLCSSLTLIFSLLPSNKHQETQNTQNNRCNKNKKRQEKAQLFKFFKRNERIIQSKIWDLRFIESIVKSFIQLAEVWGTSHRRGNA